MTPQELKDLGLKLFREERLTEATEKFKEAAQAFATAGDQSSEAEMKNNLSVIYLAEKDFDAALAAVEGTPAVFERLGDTLRQAQALMNLANAHDGADHTEQAADLYMQAIDLFDQLGEKENRAACWKALSGMQLRHGKQLQAMASMQSGLKLTDQLSPKEKMLKGMLDKAMKLIGPK